MISVSGLRKSFGRVPAVAGLSFTAPAGQVTGLLGPNGAGKTTTLRILLGLVRADDGTAHIDGRRYADWHDPVTVTGAVLETAAFHPGRTARTHLTAVCLAARLPARRVGEVLDTVDLAAAADRRTSGFSLGMRQRLALATALLGDPRVLVLDEPANGLDPAGTHWLRGFLRAMASDGRTVLVSSHDLTGMTRLADRVVIVDRGAQVAEDTVAAMGDLEDTYLRLVAR